MGSRRAAPSERELARSQHGRDAGATALGSARLVVLSPAVPASPAPNRGGHAMNSHLRRPFVLMALLALVLAVGAAAPLSRAAPVSSAADPTNTKVAGI